MVQLPEKCPDDSEARKAGFGTICDIAKERIRRAGEKVKGEHSNISGILDTGFRVLKLDSTNMEDVFYHPKEQTTKNLFEDNIKKDRGPEDILFQVMLNLGISLSSKIEESHVGERTIYSVDSGYLIACLGEGIDQEVIEFIADRKPDFAVFQNNGFVDDATRVNVEQIFLAKSPGTIRKVI